MGLMADILARIIETKKDEVQTLKTQCSARELRTRIADLPAPRGFTTALKQAASNGYGLIAEIKKASPSKGVIRADFDPASLARAYEDGGATCLSVLTDSLYFEGGLEHLVAARQATHLPILRKDFMIDPHQVLESRAHGADAILIIVGAVDDALAQEIESAADEFGMAVLVEIHNQDELTRALNLKSPLLGVNNRNLHTMQTNLDIGEALLGDFPQDRLAIAESGLNTAADLARMARAGARMFLIGESLMRQSDVAAATRAILANPIAPERESA